MDREQYTNAQSHLPGIHTGLGDYRSPPDAYPNLSGSYLGQSTVAYDSRSSGLYIPTSYAASQYMTGQAGYSNDATQYSRSTALTSSLYQQRTSGVQEQPYSASLSSGYSLGVSRYGSSHVDGTSRSDMDRYSATNTLGGLSSMYTGRSGYAEPGARYDDGRSERSLLLSEPTGTGNSHLPSWTPSSLSTIDPPRSS